MACNGYVHTVPVKVCVVLATLVHVFVSTHPSLQLIPHIPQVMLDPERLLPPTKHKMSSKASKKMESSSSSTDQDRHVVSPSLSSPLKLIHPLMEAAADVHYNYLRCLHVWHLPLSDEDIVSLVSIMYFHCSVYHHVYGCGWCPWRDYIIRVRSM